MPWELGRTETPRAAPLDLSVLERSAAFDRMIALARCAAAAFYVIGSIIKPGDNHVLTLLIGVALCIGSALGLAASPAWTSRPAFGVISFLFDGTIIMLMLANALDDPFDVVYGTGLLVVFEGARWGVKGGIAAGAWMGAAAAVWTGEVRDRAGIAFEVDPMLQRLALFLIIGCGIGTMIHRLHQQRTAIQKVVDLSHDGFLTLSEAGRILSCNESAELILGVTAEELVGARFTDLFVPSPGDITAQAALQRGGTRELEIADQPGRWIEALLTDVAELGYSFIVCRDVTARATQAQRLAHDAHHDELTQLANRRRLMQELGAALDPKRSSQPVSLLLVDLDDFKRVNDTLGHLVGDELLVALAERIGRLVRPSDVAVRLGGDEFAIMMRSTKGLEPAQALAERVLAVIGQPVSIGAASATVSASIGFVVGSPQDATVDQMLHDADVALYAAKAQGKNLVVAHQPGLAEKFLDGHALSEDLALALQEDRGLHVVYQPIFALDSPRRIVAVEALCRWTHPTLGALDPESFVAAAEKSGRGVELDRFVRQRAMADLASIGLTNGVDLHLNLSSPSLADPNLLRLLLEDSAAFEFTLNRLVLEVTEDVAIEHSDELVARLTKLRELGTQIALDDFGTGQASLASLRWVPVDMLKIDRSFVHRAVGTGLRETALVDAVLKLGASMELAVIAEGIETEDELESLLAAGCVLGQGFLMGRPMGISEVGALLIDNAGHPATAG